MAVRFKCATRVRSLRSHRDFAAWADAERRSPAISPSTGRHNATVSFQRFCGALCQGVPERCARGWPLYPGTVAGTAANSVVRRSISSVTRQSWCSMLHSTGFGTYSARIWRYSARPRAFSPPGAPDYRP